MSQHDSAFERQETQGLTIAGGGSIGVAMALVFADSGQSVELVEVKPERRSEIHRELPQRYQTMVAAGLTKTDATTTMENIAVLSNLNASKVDPFMVLEAGPEVLSTKRTIFSEIFAQVGSHTLVATTSSAIPVSKITSSSDQAQRSLCAHCVNPPTIMRLIECVPSPQTNPGTTANAMAYLAQAGFAPVLLNKEIPGFALNRLQGAILREAYRLVADGVISATDLDRVMTDGLGPRWALCGPFETAELNTPGGIRSHAQRMGQAYREMGRSRGEKEVDWPDGLVAEVERQRRAVLPLDELPKRREWREKALARLLFERRAILNTWPTDSEEILG